MLKVDGNYRTDILYGRLHESTTFGIGELANFSLWTDDEGCTSLNKILRKHRNKIVTIVIQDETPKDS